MSSTFGDIEIVSGVICDEEGGVFSLRVHIVHSVAHVRVGVSGHTGGGEGRQNRGGGCFCAAVVVVHCQVICVSVSIKPAPDCVHVSLHNLVDPENQISDYF